MAAGSWRIGTRQTVAAGDAIGTTVASPFHSDLSTGSKGLRHEQHCLGKIGPITRLEVVIPGKATSNCNRAAHARVARDSIIKFSMWRSSAFPACLTASAQLGGDPIS